MPLNGDFRAARIGEHLSLTELVFRSVQTAWNYSDDFMAWEPEAIEVTQEHILEGVTNVLEVSGKIAGFYVLRGDPPEIEMSRLMVEPNLIGAGYGRQIWNHAVFVASDMGASVMTLDADPNAEPFYLRMGAVTIGEHEWEPPMMPGWRLKKMRYEMSRT